MKITHVISNLTQLVTKNHSDLDAITANDHHSQVHTYDVHTDITRSVFYPAPAGSGSVGVSSDNKYAVQSFPNGSDETVTISFLVPEDYVSDLILKCVWYANVASGDAYFSTSFNAGGDAESINTHNGSSMTHIFATSGANKHNIDTILSVADLSALSAGDVFGVEFMREGSKVTDTLGVTVYLVGFVIQYTARQ